MAGERSMYEERRIEFTFLVNNVKIISTFILAIQCPAIVLSKVKLQGMISALMPREES
jgi:hypothetical protein